MHLSAQIRYRKLNWVDDLIKLLVVCNSEQFLSQIVSERVSHQVAYVGRCILEDKLR